MTPEMAQRLSQIASTKPRNVSEADLIRNAIRHYLDEQEDLVGSRRHFQRALQARVDELEDAIAFQLNVLVYLLAHDQETVREAIIAARERGKTLLAQMKAVRAIQAVDP